jgi:hypothetical protein
LRQNEGADKLKFKTMKHFKAIAYRMAMLAIPMAIIFSSCKEEEPTPPAPTVSVSNAAITGIPGATVTAVVTVDAPGGGRTLKVQKNGVADTAFPDVALNSAATSTYNFSFAIPSNSPVGTETNFVFTAIDDLDQSSEAAVLKVTVSAVPNKPIVEVSGTLTGNINWVNTNIYKLKGFVRIGQDVIPSGSTSPVVGTTGTLTIQEGTVIIGERSSKATLVIQRGSKIIANGTAAKPIVFTSERAIGTREAGDWGGLVICGRGINNISGTLGVGIGELEGQYAAYHGGTDDADNSGSLQYVRIEFAGVPINPNQEVNSLTMGSVGSGTVLKNVQASFGLDDSFEWFGGAVNAQNLIAYRGLDDDWDVDNGYKGKVQFGLSIRDKDLADQSGANSFEVDNDGTGSGNTPFTSATFSNMTVIGPKANRETAISLQFQSAAQLRRNNKIKIINSFFTGFPNGVFLDNNGSVPVTTNAQNGDLVLKNNVLAGVDNWGGNGFGSVGTIFPVGTLGNGANHPTAPRGFRVGAGTGAFSNGIYTLSEVTISTKSAEDWFDDNNTILAKWTDAGISSTIFDSGITPTLLPTTGSVLLAGADFTGFTGMTSVTYKGAFGTTDWTTGWVNWNPNNTDYSK